MLKGQQKIKIKMSLTNSLQYQNGVFEGGNGFNAFSREILFAMKIFCHIGNDEYYRCSFTAILTKKREHCNSLISKYKVCLESAMV